MRLLPIAALQVAPVAWDPTATLKSFVDQVRAVRDTFPDAWGKPPSRSRLMHSAGIRAVGRLMDKILATVDTRKPSAEKQVREDLALIAPYCRWTEGNWEGLGGLRWDEVQNVPRHIRELSSFLVRVHLQVRRAA